MDEHGDDLISPLGSTAVAARERRAARDAAYREQWNALAGAREVAWQIVKYRLAHGLTQADLAARVGTSRAQIARVESGRHLPSVATLQRISDALACRLAITFELRSEPGQQETAQYEGAPADLDGS